MQFNEELCNGWHLYAVELCLQCHNNGINVCVLDCGIEHLSKGNVDNSYNIAFMELLERYKKNFYIITTTCGWGYTHTLPRTFYDIKEKMRKLQKRGFRFILNRTWEGENVWSFLLCRVTIIYRLAKARTRLYQYSLVGNTAEKETTINHIKALKDQMQSSSHCIRKCKVAVYTSLYGNYDTIKPVKFANPNCDYFIFTDQFVPQKSGWIPKDARFPKEIVHAPDNMKNRYCKMNAHLLFPEYEYSIYLDSKIELKYDIFPLIGKLGEYSIGMYYHSHRDCIYKECNAVIECKKADRREVIEWEKYLRTQGFPEHFGLTENCVIVRKHNDCTCVEIMENWWTVFQNGVKRDQLSLMYILWKLGYSISDVAKLGDNNLWETRFLVCDHLRMKG